MPIPDYQTLMLPVLQIASSGEEINLSKATTEISGKFNLSEVEQEEMLPSGTQSVIKNRMGWAVTYLVKANLLKRTRRSHFQITERGSEVLATNPNEINKKYLEQFQEFVEFTNKKNKGSGNSTDEETAPITPEERISEAFTEISDELKSDLLNRVLEATPEFFEVLIVKLLVEMGYGGSTQEAGEHLGKSGDGGIDGVIKEDKLGLDKIYVQAKRYAIDNKIGRPAIQAFTGSLVGFGANKGVFVTTSTFSSQAHEYVDQIPQSIILIDGDMLTKLMIENNVGVRLHQSIELKRIDEDFFIE